MTLYEPDHEAAPAAGSALPSDPDEPRQGRIGYGAYARYTPTVLGLLLVAVVAFIGWREWRPDDELPRTGTMLDQPAPPFALTLLDGSVVSSADLSGRAVALNFWASWCAPCKSEMPALQQVSDALASSRARATVVGVGIKNDYEPNALEMLEALGISYPVGRDTAGDDPQRGPIETDFGIVSYPSTVFIRPDGTIFAVRIGEVAAEEIEAYLEAAMESG
jgi:thiol-disulfide isomerase/thioredoxin